MYISVWCVGMSILYIYLYIICIYTSIYLPVYTSKCFICIFFSNIVYITKLTQVYIHMYT